jgi:hypothetical protein
MNKMKILDQDFEVLNRLENISIADSFVSLINKIGKGNGEAKLYVGQDNDTLYSFFGERGFILNCFLLKEDLVQYLNEVRKEHKAPTQEYKNKETLEEIWDSKLKRVTNLDDIIPFKVNDQDTLQGPRIYINSKSQDYQLLREIPLPIISHLDIIKVRNLLNSEIEYYFYLYSDYTNDIEEDEEIEADDSEFEPFNPELISIDTKKVTMDTLLRRLKQNTIKLNPDFQRNYVWTADKKCQLIESLMLKIPLPMFYVSSDEKGNFTVVDGLQRISTIRDYIIDEKFKLQKLEFWGSLYNGDTFKDLPTYIINRILETEFTFTVINQGTPEVVKRNIFKRVNRGGAPLTDQEIRNALYSGKATKLLKDLAKTEEFLKATNNSIRASRMLDKEFILRFLSFTIRDYSLYPKNGNIDMYLSDTLKIVNDFPNLKSKEVQKISDTIDNDVKITNIDEIKTKFLLGMKRSLDIFGEHTFRKSYYGRRKTPINKALFEVWSVLLSQITEDGFIILKENKKDFLKEYKRDFLQDIYFNDILSRNAVKYSSVIKRYTKMGELLKRYSNDK